MYTETSFTSKQCHLFSRALWWTRLSRCMSVPFFSSTLCVLKVACATTCLTPASTSQLSQFRGRDKNFTLLHALVEQIMLREPCLAAFTQELAEFETVPGGTC